MTDYTITDIGSLPQWVVSTQGKFVQESISLTAALAYLATVLTYGDTIDYINEPVAPV